MENMARIIKWRVFSILRLNISQRRKMLSVIRPYIHQLYYWIIYHPGLKFGRAKLQWKKKLLPTVLSLEWNDWQTVVLHFRLWKFYNFSHKLVEMQNSKWWLNESDNLNMSLKLNHLKTVQIWSNLDIWTFGASRNTLIRTGSVVSSFFSFSLMII